MGACSLVHQDLPNESPVLEAVKIDTTQVGRGGQVRLEARASDEDDDRLSYNWHTPLSGGTFDPPTSARTTWTAPLSFALLPPSQLTSASVGGQTCQAVVFPLFLTIRDRACEEVPDQGDKAICQDLVNETTLPAPLNVTVVQCLPQLSAPADTTIACTVDGCPEVTLAVEGLDPDGDPLTFSWEQVEGEDLVLRDRDEDEVKFTDASPGDYLLQIVATDGSDTTRADIAVHLLPEDG